MPSLLLKLSLVLSLCFPLFSFAHAAPIAAGTYTLSGVTVNGSALNGSALNGSVTLGSDGLATSASFMYDNAVYNNPTFGTINSKGVSGNNPTANFAYVAGSNGQVALYYLQTLNAAGGITLCEAGTNCAQASYLQIYSPNLNSGLVGGSLAAGIPASAAVTPEPSSYILMFTGALMIGAVILLRKRQQGSAVTF